MISDSMNPSRKSNNFLLCSLFLTHHNYEYDMDEVLIPSTFYYSTNNNEWQKFLKFTNYLKLEKIN